MRNGRPIGWRAGSILSSAPPATATPSGRDRALGFDRASPHTHLPSPLDYAGEDWPRPAIATADPTVHGFGLTHLSGVGCPDLGAPWSRSSGGWLTDFDAYGRAPRRGARLARLLSVDLADGGCAPRPAPPRVPPSLRLLRAARAANLLLDVARSLSWAGGSGTVRVVSPTEIEGESQTGLFCAQANRRRVYFVLRFDHAAESAGTWKDGVPPRRARRGGRVGAWLRFRRRHRRGFGRRLLRRASAPAPTWTSAASSTRSAAPPSPSGRRCSAACASRAAPTRSAPIFYTALYHALLHPSLASDVDGAPALRRRHRHKRCTALSRVLALGHLPHAASAADAALPRAAARDAALAAGHDARGRCAAQWELAGNRGTDDGGRSRRHRDRATAR